MKMTRHDRHDIMELFVRGFSLERLAQIYGNTYTQTQIEGVLRGALKKIGGGKES